MHYTNLEKTITSLIESGRLNSAVKLLKNQCVKELTAFPELRNIIEKLDKISETYRYLVGYLFQGLPDDSRDNTFKELKEQLLQLTASFVFFTNSQNANDSFFSAYRLQVFEGKTLDALLQNYARDVFRLKKSEELEAGNTHLQKNVETDIEKIFNKVMTLPIADDEIKVVSNAILEYEDDYFLPSQLIAALTLSSLRFYDKEKLLAMIDIYEKVRSEKIQARLLFAIVLIISAWKDKIIRDQSLVNRIENLTDSIINYLRLRDVIMIIIRTRDTDRVNKKIEEVFNNMMKTFGKHDNKDIRERLGTLDPMELEENPEWKKLMVESGIQDKIMDINEMQMNGMDVMMQAFAKLKHFPFFRSLPNWFLPFSFRHSSIAEIASLFHHDVLETMAKASDMCSNDKYSFMLGLSAMPQERINAMAAQLEGAMEQFKEELKSRSLKAGSHSDFYSETLGFARDLYRFLKLYPNRKDYTDVFEDVIDFCNLPGLSNLLSENEVVEMLGEFYFTYGYYSEALPLLQILADKGNNDMHLYEKLGYCHQVLGNSSEALDNYEKADLFSSDATPSSSWLIQKIAFCNKILGKYDKALEYYRKALERDPENVSLLINSGNASLAAGQSGQAVDHLSKALYFHPENEKVLNSLIKVYIKTGELDKALTHINKLMSVKESHSVLRLRGILEFIKKNYKEASVYFAKGYDGLQDRSSYIHSLLADVTFYTDGNFDKVAFEITTDNAFL